MYISVELSSLSALDVLLCDDFLPFSRESFCSQIVFSNDSWRFLEVSSDLRVGMSSVSIALFRPLRVLSFLRFS